jgi:hypothetical protein
MNIQKTITNVFAFALLLTFVTPAVANDNTGFFSSFYETIKNALSTCGSYATDNVVTNGITDGAKYAYNTTTGAVVSGYNMTRKAGEATINLANENKNYIFAATAAAVVSYVAYKAYVAKTEKKAEDKAAAVK